MHFQPPRVARERRSADIRFASESTKPIAVTRHGATIGIYVPTKPKASQEDLDALRIAGEKMQELIAAAGITEDEIVGDFKKARR